MAPLLVLALGGCPPDLGRFRVVDGGPGDGGEPVDGAMDARTDARAMDSAVPVLDAPFDAGRDATPFDGGFDARGSGLDPDLAPASGDGAPCDTPGSLSECPGIEVCRFYTATESRCESCEPCGNLGDFCTRSSECDILFMCFRNECTNFCQRSLGCSGVPEWCVDVGHPTHGVCVIPP